MSAAEINWTDPALDDLDAVYVYVGRNAPAYAGHFVQQILLAVDRLDQFPFSGRHVPEAESSDVREVIFQSYRIFYWIVEQQRIDIIGVVHGSRDLADPDNQPWRI